MYNVGLDIADFAEYLLAIPVAKQKLIQTHASATLYMAHNQLKRMILLLLLRVFHNPRRRIVNLVRMN